MASITYNGLSSPENIITFTDIPNILKVTANSGGTRAYYTLTFVGNLYEQTNADGQWYITLFGETITNVLNPSNAVNKSFYVAQTSNSTAASVAKALRNCANIAANFTVEQSGTSVTIKSRDVGSIFYSGYFDTNISQGYMSRSGTDGSVPQDSLQGALIDVDIYSNNEYITTLEKNWYNGEAAFNMSPVLTTLASDGKVVQYALKVSSMKDGEYALLGNVGNNYISVGYMCNQGYKYLINNSLNIAQNFSRGKSREFENNTILYLYEPSINISLYTSDNGGFSYSIDYLDSAYNVITSYTYTFHCSTNSLLDMEIPLNHSGYAHFQRAFYIDLTIGSTHKIRYNVIKPLKATEYSQRVLWRNSYGGISFFDFTGQRSETRDADISTYQKNIFDYYTSEMNELEKMYDNEIKYTVTLKSHLFETDGKYVFNDLIQSSQVWTEINGENYAIILDSVSVDETNNNGIYEATIKYHYSQEPSLI